jgi:hypothetical protein
MKHKLHHILLTLSLSIITPAGLMVLHAQDATFDGGTVSSEKERINYSPGGEGEPVSGGSSASSSSVNTNTRVSTAARDSASMRNPTRIPVTPDPGKNMSKPSHEDDVLSFNFLYYIIRKYKLQDIVD